MKLLAIVALATMALALPPMFGGRTKGGFTSHLHENITIDPVLLASHNTGTKWLTQKQDHFDSANTKTWKQQYFFNYEYKTDESTVNFLYISGEQSASLGMITGDSSSYVHYAMKMNASLYALEHRFYGESHPTEDMSVENLKYLSSRQAIEDIAEFIRQINEEKEGEQKWIVIGGSYAGALAAWSRLKHPELIIGALSSSAPVLAQMDFYGYLQTVDEDFKKVGGLCYSQLEDGIKGAVKMLQTPEGRQQLSLLFRMRPPLSSFDVITNYDIDTFFKYVITPFFGSAQNNFPSIHDLCSSFTAHGPGYDPVKALAFINPEGSMNINFTDSVLELSGVEYKGDTSARLWLYQTCAEFGYFHSTDRGTNVFGQTQPSNTFMEYCIQLFGITVDQIQKNVESTNQHYGERDYYAGTNVVFSHGTQDPWSFLTKKSDPKHWSVVILEIEGGSHVSDLGLSCSIAEDYCSANMLQVQTLTLENMQRWVDPVFPVPDSVEISDNVGKRPQLFDANVANNLQQEKISVDSVKLRAQRSEGKIKNSKIADFKKWSTFTGKGRKVLLPPPVSKNMELSNDIGQGWIEQTWDHFNQNEERTFKQKWYYNYKFGSRDGPNFLMIGGEGPEDIGWVQYEDLAWMTYAKAVGANVFLLEHRYYGESKLGTTDLQYLTSAQMLYDVATFIRTQQVNQSLTGPWITFGGSYPGALAAWSREWFPELILGAVGSSGPVLAKNDFYEYLEVVEDVIRRQSQKCYDRTAEAFNTLQKLIQDPEGRAIIQEKFVLWPEWTADSNDTIDPLDMNEVFSALYGMYQGTVQYNSVDWSDVASLCSIMENEEVDSLDALSNLRHEAYGDDEILSSFDIDVLTLKDMGVFIDGLDDTYSDEELAGYLWTWQTCNEFGYYQTTDYGEGIFGTPVPINFFIIMCEKVFGVGMDRVEDGVARTNYQYGGRHRYNTTNVVLPNGDGDPWHALSILEQGNLDASVVPIVIKGTSHCADMYSATKDDPAELTQARKTILENIQRWLTPIPSPTTETPAPTQRTDKATNPTTVTQTTKTTTTTQSPTTSSSSSSTALVAIVLVFVSHGIRDNDGVAELWPITTTLSYRRTGKDSSHFLIRSQQMKWLAIVALATVATAIPEMFMGRRRGGFANHLQEKRVVDPALLADATVGHDNVTQKLDHFDSSNTKTWPQRYFYNHKYVKEGSNVNLIYLSGEQTDSYAFVVDDINSYVYYAEQLNADIYSLEHRFYGKSQPTPDTSVENLKYLSSRQAIEDIAEFIRQINAQKGGTQKWIIVGGSYAGSLSAWARLKHPELIAGSIASSGPVRAELDFYGYLQTVDDDFRNYGGLCYDQLGAGIESARKLLQSEAGRDKLSTLFKITPPFSDYDVISDYDIFNFYSYLTYAFELSAQYDSPPIDTLCKKFTSHGVGYDPLQALRDLIPAKDVIDVNFTASVEEMAGIEYKGDISDRLWFYQTCTEFGYFQSTNRGSNVFGQSESSNAFIEYCVQLFGINADQIEQGIEATNQYYGARNYYAGTNVVFSHGTQDPWSFLAEKSNPKHWSVVIVEVEGGSHCADIGLSCFHPTSKCTANMKQIQTLTLENMRRWIDPVFPVPDRVDITDNVGKRPQFFNPNVNAPLAVNQNTLNKAIRGKRSVDTPKFSKKIDFKSWNKFTGKGRNVLLPPPVTGNAALSPSVVTGWIEQTWDHFNPNEERTFKQKFYSNPKFGTQKGPNFLMIGGEGPESGSWASNENVAWMTYAQTVGANVFLLEHRYYGESKLGTNDLQYLTSAQMLYDVATFIRTQQVNQSLTGPWITFGGSYPGALAAWSREWFPELILGAVGSSGPVLAKNDFYEYLEVVEDVIRRQSQKCYDRTAEAFKSLQKLAQDPKGRAVIQDKFVLSPAWTADPNEVIDQLDINEVFSALYGMYQGTVQYNSVDWSDVAALCAIMEDAQYADSLDALKALRKETYGTDPLLSSYNKDIQSLIDMQTYVDGHDNKFSDNQLSGLLWTWQTCNEFGYYQTTDYGEGIFGTPVPINFFIIMCEKVFGVGMDRVEDGVARTNYQYGGRHRYNTTNVVLPNGDGDPWHALSILEQGNLDASVVPIVIKGTSHCADMYEATKDDPAELTQARKTILENIQRWLSGTPAPVTSPTVSPTTSSAFTPSLLLTLLVTSLFSFM